MVHIEVRRIDQSVVEVDALLPIAQALWGLSDLQATLNPYVNARRLICVAGQRPGEDQGERARFIIACYRQSLELVESMGLNSIAFSEVSREGWGYTISELVCMAVDAVSSYFRDNPRSSIERVVFLVSSEVSEATYQAVL